LTRRTDRVRGLLRQEISRLVQEDLSDPRLRQLVTFSYAELSGDLAHATLGVTVLGGEQEQQETIAGLQAAAGYLKRALGQRLRLKRTPELRFVLDHTIMEGDHVLGLLDEIRQRERASDV